MLRESGDLEVVGEAANASEAHEVVRATEPDLVVADMVLEEGPDGIQLTKALKAQWPFLHVLLLSAHDESLFAERALGAGASGYVMKDEAVDVLLEAILDVLAGRIWLSPDMIARLGSTDVREGVVLHTAEQAVLAEMSGGNSTTPGLARRLGLTWAEVEQIRRSIRESLGLRTDVELILYASQRPSSRLT